MGLWSNKAKKLVKFTEEVADQTLLAAVETELQKQPHKTFSDLCKEALWQFLYVPESVRPTPKSGQVEQQIADLQGQLVSLEQRIAAREASRLEALESQLHQFSFQLAQLAIAVNQRLTAGPAPEAPAELTPEPETMVPPQQEVDPLLSRLGSLLDDF